MTMKSFKLTKPNLKTSVNRRWGFFTCQLCYDGVDEYKQKISLVIILETFDKKKIMVIEYQNDGQKSLEITLNVNW